MESIAAVAERVRRYVNDAMEEVAERAHGASAETESIRASLVAINADLEAEVSSLEDALRAAESKEAASTSAYRAIKAELDELKDAIEPREQKLRAELDLWKQSSVRYRKRFEHAEAEIRRARGGHAVEGVRAPVRGAGGGATKSPSVSPAAAAPAAAAATTTERGASDAVAAAAAERPTAPPSPTRRKRARAPSPPAPTTAPGPSAPPPRAVTGGRGGKWRKTGALANEASLRRSGRRTSTAAAQGLWGGGGGGGGGDADGGKHVEGALAEEDRTLFKIAPRRKDDVEGDARGGPGDDADATARTTRDAGARGGFLRARDVNAAPPGVKYSEVVRNKAERALLPSFTCDECDAFYGANSSVRRPGGACTHCPGPGDVSRHRAKWAPPPAPAGYWNLGFGTQGDEKRASG